MKVLHELKPSYLLAAAALIAAVAAAGCSGSSVTPAEPEGPVASRLPMGFEVVADTPASRAPEPLQLYFDDFGVYAWKINASGDVEHVMRHDDELHTPYEVRYDGAKWIYELTSATGHAQYLKYWDPTATEYTFRGYAPYTHDASNTVTVDESGISITAIKSGLPASATRWAICDYTRAIAGDGTAQDYDNITGNPVGSVLPALNATVPLRFHSLVSGVEIRAYLSDPGEVKVTALEVTFGTDIYTSADYANGAYTRSDPSSTLVALDPLSITVDKKDQAQAVTLASLYEIPQSIDGKEITFKVTLETGEVLTGTFTLAGSWDPDMRYIYYLQITPGLNIILVDILSTDDWTQEDDIDVQDPVINW